MPGRLLMRFLQRRSLLRFLQRGAVRAILQRRVLSARVLNPRGFCAEAVIARIPDPYSRYQPPQHLPTIVAPESSSLQYLPTVIAAIWIPSPCIRSIALCLLPSVSSRPLSPLTLGERRESPSWSSPAVPSQSPLALTLLSLLFLEREGRVPLGPPLRRREDGGESSPWSSLSPFSPARPCYMYTPPQASPLSQARSCHEHT